MAQGESGGGVQAGAADPVGRQHVEDVAPQARQQVRGGQRTAPVEVDGFVAIPADHAVGHAEIAVREAPWLPLP